MAVGRFFSAAPTAQNSPELHFRFINYLIQPSLAGSLPMTLYKCIEIFSVIHTIIGDVVKTAFWGRKGLECRPLICHSHSGQTAWASETRSSGYNQCLVFLAPSVLPFSLVWGILADFWVPHEIDSWNLQNLHGLGSRETFTSVLWI